MRLAETGSELTPVKIIGLAMIVIAAFACSNQQELTSEEYAKKMCQWQFDGQSQDGASTVGEVVALLRERIKQMEALTPPEQYLRWHNENVGLYRHVFLKGLEEFDTDEPFTASLIFGSLLVGGMAVGQVIDQIEQDMAGTDLQVLADAGCNVGTDITATPTTVADTSPPVADAPASTAETAATPGDGRAYAAPPSMTIDSARSYEAVIRTRRGDVRITLLPEAAPGYVNNFVFLAREGFYDGITFHRVIPGFVAQAGDPTGTGSGSAGYDLAEERNDLPFAAGVLSMAKGGSIVSGSQFFVTLAPTPHLEGSFTVFGRVASGLDVLQSLTPRDPRLPGQPPGDRILAIDIIEGGSAEDADATPATAE